MGSLNWWLQLRKLGREQVQNTSGDSFELYCGLFMYNPNAIEEVKREEKERKTYIFQPTLFLA